MRCLTTSGLIGCVLATAWAPSVLSQPTLRPERPAPPNSVLEPTTRSGISGFFVSSAWCRELMAAWEVEPLLRAELAETSSAAHSLGAALALETGARMAAQEEVAIQAGEARSAHQRAAEAASRAWWESPWIGPVAFAVGAVVGVGVSVGIALGR